MSERCPFAADWLLPEVRTQPRIQVRGLVMHSIVGSSQAAYGHFLNSSDLESTFILGKNGYLAQTMYADQRADANGQGNAYYASVETEDNRDPDNDPWTDEQVDMLVRLSVWYHTTFGVPLQRIPNHGGSGYGYHTMFGAPGPWTQVRGKTCPGRVRVDQFNDLVLPRITGLLTSEEDMPLNDADKTFIDQTAAKWMVPVLQAVEDVIEAIDDEGKETRQALRERLRKQRENIVKDLEGTARTDRGR